MSKSVADRFREGLSACLYDLNAANRLLIALSGGADSVAMLRLFLSVQDKERIVCCHVHHGIRTEEAERDLDFCRNLCATLGVEFHAVRVNVPAVCEKEKTGLEETARKLRYAALERVAEKTNCPLIATAHNADDHLETVLFHLARGSGSLGMQGIAPRRGNIIRPLLPLTKAEIVGYLADLRQDFVQDSTNECDAYTRNYIRHNILPAMRQINPEAARASLGMSAALRQDEEFLCSLLPEKEENAAELSPVLLHRHLSRAYFAAGGRGATREHYLALCRLAKQGREGERLSLPGGITACRMRGKVRFEPTLRQKKTAQDSEIFPVLREKDSVSSHGAQIRLLDCESGQKVYNLSTISPVSSAIMNGSLYWRYRRAGDTVRLGGMTRKVKELLRALGLSEQARAAYPIVCDEKGPVWVPGYPVRDDMRPNEGEEYCFLQYQR